MKCTQTIGRFTVVCIAVIAIAGGTDEVTADILYVANTAGGSIGAYETDGTTINAHLITGLQTPDNIAISGTDLYVTNYNGGSVGKYDTAGGTINANLITGITYPSGIAVNGSQLFVASQDAVDQYSTSGGSGSLFAIPYIDIKSLAINGGQLFVAGYATGFHGSVQQYGLNSFPINDNLLPSTFAANYLTVYNGHIYVSDYFTGSIIDITTAGDVVNSNFITGLKFPTGVVASGGHLFVATQENNTGGPGKIGEYNLDGSVVNASLITGLSDRAGWPSFPRPSPPA